MKNFYFVTGLFFSILFSYETRACVADADCSGGQVCLKCKSTEQAWQCGGDCIIPHGGRCCINPDCILSASTITPASKDRKRNEVMAKN